MSVIVGRALPIVIVWTPPPEILKLMLSGPACRLASVIAARSEQTLADVAQIPSPGALSPTSDVELTVNVRATAGLSPAAAAGRGATRAAMSWTSWTSRQPSWLRSAGSLTRPQLLPDSRARPQAIAAVSRSAGPTKPSPLMSAVVTAWAAPALRIGAAGAAKCFVPAPTLTLIEPGRLILISLPAASTKRIEPRAIDRLPALVGSRVSLARTTVPLTPGWAADLVEPAP